MSFTSVGDKTRTIIPRQEDYSIDYDFFATGTSNIPAGSMVKIKTGGIDGEVEIVGAVTDDAIGLVSVGTKGFYKKEQRITVKTPFVAILYVEAKVALAYGDKVNQSGLSTVNTEQPVYAKVTAGNPYYGVVLQTGAVGATVAVGVLRVSKIA